MNSDRPERDAVSERIIGGAFAVANTLGHGFLEKVYENALALEPRAAGFAVEQQWPIVSPAIMHDAIAELESPKPPSAK